MLSNEVMPAPYIPPITPQLWMSNLLQAAGAIADKTMQERCWSTGTWNIWEQPDELINTVDDCELEGFIEAFNLIFTSHQKLTIVQFRDAMDSFCAATSDQLNPAEVLVSPQWEIVRQHAAAFVHAFEGSWPPSSSQNEASRLLQLWMQAHAAKSKKLS